jgi:hypothetical protein
VPPYLTGGKASKHLVPVLCIPEVLSISLPPVFLRAGELLVTSVKTLPAYCFRLIFTVSGSHLGRAATVWGVLVITNQLCFARPIHAKWSTPWLSVRDVVINLCM